MKTVIAPVLAALVLAGCSSISETRMMAATPRPADCSLQLVQADITQIAFNQTWDVLGYVTLGKTHSQDPASEENRHVVRPRACAMGGTAIAVAINATSHSAFATGSALAYMVLRPKQAAAAPTTF